LKFENILINGDIDKCEIKITDFSLSALIRLDENGYDSIDSEKRKKYVQLIDICCSTKEYLAPEIIKKQYGPQVDVWAIGCILYEMLTTSKAFLCDDEDTQETFYKRICKGKYDINK
jgi:calcium-dependent protein kinase